MAIDALALFAEARNTYGFTGTLTDVQNALAAVDRTPLEAEENAHYEVRIWDEVSDLGGRPAEWWRQHFGNEWPAGGKVLLVFVDGNLHTVQPFDPRSSGFVPMDEATAMAVGEAMVSERVEAAVDAKVKKQVLLALLAG